MLKIEGARNFHKILPEELWARLSDARFLVDCLPDVEKVNKLEPDHAELLLKPGFSFVRGSLELSIKVVYAVCPESVKWVTTSKGIASSSKVEVTMALSAVKVGTHVEWVMEIKELTGLLKMVPPGLIRGAAEQVIKDVWALVVRKLPKPEDKPG